MTHHEAVTPVTERTKAWSFACGLVFLAVMLAWFRPYMLPNESIYLIPGKKLFSPLFLAYDWTWQRGDTSHIIFDLFAGPLTLVLKPLPLVLAGRLLQWGLLIWAMARMSAALDLGPWEFAAGFGMWFSAGQTIVAGEWIFSGFEAKCFSYFFLFLAIENMLRDRFFRAAVYAGLAGSFHVLVGGWGLIALTAAMAAKARSRKQVPLVSFTLLALLFALPGLVPAFAYSMRGGGMSLENYQICVLFRDFNHLDPQAFLTRRKAAEMLVYSALAIFFLAKRLSRERAIPLIVFLGTLLLVFAAGLAAREVFFLRFLYYYPFRLAPVFVLLFFFFLGVRLLDSCAGMPGFLARQRKKTGSLLVLLALMLFQVPQNVWSWGKDFSLSWKRFAQHEKIPFQETAEWIRTNLPADAVLAAPPWEYRFWLFSERAVVAAYKQPPINSENREWRDRLVALNGGKPFSGNGKAALAELHASYPELTLGQLQTLRRLYGAGYYVNEKPRPDLGLPLLFSNEGYSIYKIEGANPVAIEVSRHSIGS